MNNYWYMGLPSGKVPEFDFPMLKLSMTNLQSSTDQKTVDGGQIPGNSSLAQDYSENRELPSYMEHLVGKIEVCTRPKTHLVGGQERRVRGSGTWIINMVVCGRDRVRKGFSEPMVSPFMQDFFAIKEPKYDDEEMTFKL